ncbi:MAG: hypothetical protein ACYCQJ_10850 [Nitrososphaerales archaeon]
MIYYQKMTGDPWFPYEILKMRRGSFNIEKFVNRFVAELLELCRPSVILGKSGWYYPRPAIGWAAKYAHALGGITVGRSKYLGQEALLNVASGKASNQTAQESEEDA